ncbi:uncharacterized protein LOC126738428 [Anthonomus grandis grandis]|uniref:uncharacterized protein LOC126738428 n=1 Tax=Anthonomus grandis grandis TaxID=2921223 RepID=UPI0021666543|nr:uncharacterized protein LOC126738428 [Anthonomus grandis grandis]
MDPHFHRPVLEGILFVPPSGKILKKAWQKKHAALFKRSRTGIARIELYDNEIKTGPPKIITLEDVIKITPKTTNILHIVTRNSDIEFSASSEESLHNWHKAISGVAFPDERSEVSEVEQDNDLYCSTNEGIFLVKLHTSEASLRCNLDSTEYILKVEATALQLRSLDDNKVLYTWPFSFIRKYGYKSGKFTFEAGRKCASGEGTFYFEHPNHGEIYRYVTSKMKSMRQILRGKASPSLTDCSKDLQLLTALSMEAGSRNPLPLSTSIQSFADSELHVAPSTLTSIENLSGPISTHSAPIFNESLTRMPRTLNSTSNLFLNLNKFSTAPKPMVHINRNREYTQVDQIAENAALHNNNYDEVNNITEAWKQMGMEEEDSYNIKRNDKVRRLIHGGKRKEEPRPAVPYYPQQKVKQVYKPDDTSTPSDPCEYASWGPINNLNFDRTSPCSSTSKAVIQKLNNLDRDNYDHLNFFGPVNTNRTDNNSDYKEVKSPLGVAPPKQTIVIGRNEYELVGEPEGVRSADDSHLGYATVRAKSLNRSMRHLEVNAQTYAVIDKTKR